MKFGLVFISLSKQMSARTNEQGETQASLESSAAQSKHSFSRKRLLLPLSPNFSMITARKKLSNQKWTQVRQIYKSSHQSMLSWVGPAWEVFHNTRSSGDVLTVSDTPWSEKQICQIIFFFLPQNNIITGFLKQFCNTDLAICEKCGLESL